MTTRGYPVTDFEQQAADISVDHPRVMEKYRLAYAIAVRQTQGQVNTEDLRQAMIHYRTLFEELVGEPEVARAKTSLRLSRHDRATLPWIVNVCTLRVQSLCTGPMCDLSKHQCVA
jgi:hypothetical protein